MKNTKKVSDSILDDTNGLIVEREGCQCDIGLNKDHFIETIKNMESINSFSLNKIIDDFLSRKGGADILFKRMLDNLGITKSGDNLYYNIPDILYEGKDWNKRIYEYPGHDTIRINVSNFDLHKFCYLQESFKNKVVNYQIGDDSNEMNLTDDLLFGALLYNFSKISTIIVPQDSGRNINLPPETDHIIFYKNSVIDDPTLEYVKKALSIIQKHKTLIKHADEKGTPIINYAELDNDPIIAKS